MREILASIIIGGLWLNQASSARAEDPKDILEKAIKAAGGAEKLEKLKAATWKGKGKVHFGDLEIEFTGEWASQLPNKMKNEIKASFMGNEIHQVRTVDGDKGWGIMMGNLEELPEDQLKEGQEALYVAGLERLYGLKDPSFTLSPVADVMVDGKPAVGFKVGKKDHKDVTMYFDKGTYLACKSVRQVRDQMSGEDVEQESFPSAYKEVDGLNLPMKLTHKRAGKDFLQVELTDYKLADKLADSHFAKPNQ